MRTGGLLALTLWSFDAAAATVTVCRDGTCDYFSISGAITGEIADGTSNLEPLVIELSPGLYPETLNIASSNIQILGAGRGATRIRARAVNAPALVVAANVSGIIIDGLTLDVGDATRAIDVQPGADLALQDVVLYNSAHRNFTDDGPAIRVATGAEVSLDRVAVGAWSTAGRGAIKVAQDATLSVVRSLFFDNVANSGGAIDAEGAGIQLDIDESWFISNHVDGENANQFGGAVRWKRVGTIDLTANFPSWTRNAFLNNDSKGAGGAVYLENLTLSIGESYFLDNSTVAGDGGAVALISGSLGLSQSRFDDNVAGGTGRGGAVFWKFAGDDAQRVWLDDWFFHNVAGTNGGAVAFDADNKNTRLTIDRPTFEDNTAGNQGGALAAGSASASAAHIQVISGRFVSNTATNRGGAAFISQLHRGGALVSQVAPWFRDSFFCENTSTNKEGGAVALVSVSPSGLRSPVQVVRSAFVNNHAEASTGGAIFAEGTSGSVINNTFLGNTTKDLSSSAAAIAIAGSGQVPGSWTHNLFVRGDDVDDTPPFLVFPTAPSPLSFDEFAHNAWDDNLKNSLPAFQNFSVGSLTPVQTTSAVDLSELELTDIFLDPEGVDGDPCRPDLRLQTAPLGLPIDTGIIIDDADTTATTDFDLTALEPFGLWLLDYGPKPYSPNVVGTGGVPNEDPDGTLRDIGATGGGVFPGNVPGSATTPAAMMALDADNDGWTGYQGDCDQTTGGGVRRPEALEDVAFPDRDADCDGLSARWDSPDAWLPDFDGDGVADEVAFGHLEILAADITFAPPFYVSDKSVGDCNDDEPGVPGAEVGYADVDKDGWGDLDSPIEDLCAGEAYVLNALDCDDFSFDPSIPGVKMFEDVDADGYGDPETGTTACPDAKGFAPNDLDCDDEDHDINPDGIEVCDGEDNDCDGTPDDGVGAKSWYPDKDHDSFGDDSSVPVSGCSPPAGSYVDNKADCNDNNDKISPLGVEVCNDVDDDCDKSIDEGAGIAWYPDVDGDGDGDEFGSPAIVTSCDQPAGTSANSDDCDDTDASIHRAAHELVCHDGVDQNCDDQDDDGLDFTLYTIDADGDGFGDSTADPLGDDGKTLSDCAPPGDEWVLDDTDCDDTNADYHELATWYYDFDGDGLGGSLPVSACVPDEDYYAVASDCDDDDPNVGLPLDWGWDADEDGYPGATHTEACQEPTEPPNGEKVGQWLLLKGKVPDCDDTNAAVHPGTVWFLDSDADGVGGETTEVGCDAPNDGQPWTLVGGDCDDTDADVAEAGPLFEDGDLDGHGIPADDGDENFGCPSPGWALTDDDCDDDDPLAHVVTDWYDDGDKDGIYDLLGLASCGIPDVDQKWSTEPGDDCDDDNDAIGSPLPYGWDGDGDGWHGEDLQAACEIPTKPPEGADPQPGSAWIPVSTTVDCDDDDALVHPETAWFEDLDGDGVGGGESFEGCEPPEGSWVLGTGDCDDENSAVTVPVSLWTDADLDGFGDAAGPTAVDCPTPGWAPNDLDCDDAEALIGEPGPIWTDKDGDLYGDAHEDPDNLPIGCPDDPGTAGQGGDCDESNAAINPGADEVLYNNVDEDCDDLADNDADDDGVDGGGFGGDCDDNDPTISPEADEIPNDGIDQDCKGGDLVDETLLDDDNDGSTNDLDCDDERADVHPGADEVPYDGVDNDCSGADLTDVDGDGFDGGDQGDDCDDDDETVHPGAEDVPDDGVDNDCSGDDLKTVLAGGVGCGCDSGAAAPTWGLLALAGLLMRRRR